MKISDPNDALALPLGKLEVIEETDAGRVCRICPFTKDEVLAVTRKLLDQKVELIDFAAQAEIVAFMTNRFGWKEYGEAFAV